MSLPLFGEPEPQPKFPREPIARSATIEGNYRFNLRRQWSGGDCIAWAGLNPSTADGSRDDPTMWREMGFSYRWGFGSLVKVNLYPFISASPQAMLNWRRRWDPTLTTEMDHEAQEAAYRNWHDAALLLRDCRMWMAAWGNGADPDDLACWLDIVAQEAGTKTAWHCLGTTGSGAPIHPLARGLHRVPDDRAPVIWRAAA